MPWFPRPITLIAQKHRSDTQISGLSEPLFLSFWTEILSRFARADPVSRQRAYRLRAIGTAPLSDLRFPGRVLSPKKPLLRTCSRLSPINSGSIPTISLTMRNAARLAGSTFESCTPILGCSRHSLRPRIESPGSRPSSLLMKKRMGIPSNL
jgi:hypothetical protein